ncbi:MAG: hypothetical protein AAF211_00135 [Myxococcota bacterium]
MKPLTSILSLTLLSFACRPATPDGLVDAPLAEPAEPVASEVSLTLQRAGEPLERVTVIVHAPDGSVLELRETDASGSVVIDDVPAAGVGLTVPHRIFDHRDGWATVLGVTPGTTVRWGTPPPPPTVTVEARFPRAFERAERYTLGLGCRQFTAYEAEHRAQMSVDASCLPHDIVDLYVVAYADSDRLAYARLTGQPIVDGVVDADFGDVDWSTDFIDLPVVVTGAPDRLLAVLQASEGGLHRNVAPFTAAEILTRGDDWAVDVPMAPADRMESRLTLMNVSEEGEQRAIEVRRTAAIESTPSLELDLATEAPTLPQGLSIAADHTRVTVHEPSDFACGDASTATARRLTLRGRLADEPLVWEVLSPATSAETWERPELPAVLDDRWPLDDFEHLTADVELLHHRSSSYGAIVGEPEPFVTFAAPWLDDDDIACTVRLSDAMP